MIASNNVARVGFDPITATIKGDVAMISTGANDIAYLDVTKDGQFVALTTSSRTREDLYVLSVADGSIDSSPTTSRATGFRGGRPTGVRSTSFPIGAAIRCGGSMSMAATFAR